MNAKSYFTLSALSQAELIEKKSRFIAWAMPVNDENEAQAYLAKARNEHRGATHHVYAYQIGKDDQIQRSSDDGEPSGTGGRPVLEIIKKEDLHNIMVIIIRYFGGILLGTGGLTKAYSKSAAMALKEGLVIEKIPAFKYLITFDYSLGTAVENWLSRKGFMMEEKNFGEFISFSFLVPNYYAGSINDELQNLSNGTINLLNLGDEFWLESPRN